MKPFETRFWLRVKKSEGCWEWTGAYSSGYGRVWMKGGPEKASRVSFFLTHGRWPEPFVLHKCNNKRCVRPDHLYEGTQHDNMRDYQNFRLEAKREHQG